MTVPKYVKEMMQRANYEYDFCKDDVAYAAGYTIKIRKYTPYTKVDTLKAEIERLRKWVEKNNGELIALYIPNKTHYLDQAAIVTIFDPVMRYIEKYIEA